MNQRRKLVPRAEGRVLEIGFGTGLNISFYEARKVSMVMGLEPSKAMQRKAQKAIRIASVPVELIDYVGEEIPIDSDSIDTVVTTYTLCTIREYSTVLSQIRRVLKPGGRLLFCEHGLAPDENVVSWQNRLNFAWKVIGGGVISIVPFPN
ncbi:MAG: class I SAM-dependent methyltransferase, partial [Desulfobulbia bacterium]